MIVKTISAKKIVKPAVFIAAGIVLVWLMYQLPWVQRLSYPMPYKSIVQQEATKYGVDPLLVTAVIREESKFMPNSESRAGAKGVMQLMPDTALWVAQQMGLKNFQSEYLYQPEVNIMLGSWYIANLSKQFGGNPILVLAAYNGGRGRVQDWIKQGYLTGTGQIDQIPIMETKDYVKKVLQSYAKYKQLYPNIVSAKPIGN